MLVLDIAKCYNIYAILAPGKTGAESPKGGDSE